MANKIIKFSTPDCGFCKQVNSFLEQNVESIKVEIETVNPHDNPELAIAYGVMSIPVMVLVDEEGKVVKTSRGYNPSELEEIIQG
jgi:thioredoxin 1